MLEFFKKNSTFLRKEVSAAPLVTFRVLFGLVMFLSILRFSLNGWIEEFYVKPNFFFTYYGFDWIQPLGETGMYLVFATLALSSILIMLGYFYRTATITFFVLFTYIELIDKTYYLNHYYFISLISFLLIFLPAQKGISLDFGIKKMGKIPAWSIYILIFQLGVVYFFAGIAKIQNDWLLEALPLKIWLPSKSHLPIIGDFLTREWVAYIFSWTGMLYDISVPFLLLINRTRVYAYFLVVVFHIATWVLFPIGMFPFIMIALTLIFFPEKIHLSVWNKVIRGIQIINNSISNQKLHLSLKILLPLFVIIQLILPLRSLAYPGNLFWTEEGYRFSWRVMLMEKTGMCDCVVESEELSQTIVVNNSEYLTFAQERMMATQPDMILQYAHFLKNQYQEKGISNPKVYADCRVSLQGKRSKSFIDNKVNLAEINRGFQPKNGFYHLKIRITIAFILVALFGVQGFSQADKFSIRGRVICDDMDVLGNAQVFIQNSPIGTVIDMEGDYELNDVEPGTYTIVVFAYEHQTLTKTLNVDKDMEVNFHMHEYSVMEEVNVNSVQENNLSLKRLEAVDGMGIYEGRKSEVIVLDNIVANKATNNARQVYSRISGLNIWESDCAGIQLGVGGRGLSPNRSSNFNTRQNGVDISADALGYPESYYTPPIQSVEKIEIVRGAASLQYGTQFGGLLNFKLKDAPEDKKISLESSQTYGQYNFFNSYNSVSGTVGKLSYFTYYQYRSGNCWREHSGFKAHSAYGKLKYQVNEDFSISADLSFLDYLAQQPGGLTDSQFNQDPRNSNRSRNWFDINWNLMSVNLDYKVSANTKINSRFFGLIAGRKAMGNLERIDRLDNDDINRTLIDGAFRNIGNETRVLQRYDLFGNISTFIGGFRAYQGQSINTDGATSAGSHPDFNYLQADSLTYDYLNTGKNLALFAENIVTLSDKFTVTPGIRFEHIETASEGYFTKPMPVDLAGNPLLPEGTDLREFSNIVNPRNFVLIGVGLSYRPTDIFEVYGNWSQNYKSISFSDIRVIAPTLIVDPDIGDERGYSIDLGIRGSKRNFLAWELNLFGLRYFDRIGSILMRDDAFRVFRFRSNVGDALNIGIESFGEIDLFKWLSPGRNSSLSQFVNLTYLNTRYTSGSSDVVGNRVEFSPALNLRTGLTWKWNKLGVSGQISYLSAQFSDATNASNNPGVPGAVEGTIPAYYIVDFSMDYQVLEWLELSGSINNVTNNMYFTRRATGYPGPGIIPSDGINGYLSVRARF